MDLKKRPNVLCVLTYTTTMVIVNATMTTMATITNTTTPTAMPTVLERPIAFWVTRELVERPIAFWVVGGLVGMTAKKNMKTSSQQYIYVLYF